MVLAAVTVEPAEGDVEPPVRERERRPLLLGGDVVVAGVVAVRRVDVPVPEHVVARSALIATSQCRIPCQPFWPASSVSSATKISSVAGVDDGRAGDPERVDVPAALPSVGAESTTDLLTEVPTCRCQSTLPVLAAIA